MSSVIQPLSKVYPRPVLRHHFLAISHMIRDSYQLATACMGQAHRYSCKTQLHARIAEAQKAYHKWWATCVTTCKALLLATHSVAPCGRFGCIICHCKLSMACNPSDRKGTPGTQEASLKSLLSKLLGAGTLTLLKQGCTPQVPSHRICSSTSVSRPCYNTRCSPRQKERK